MKRKSRIVVTFLLALLVALPMVLASVQAAQTSQIVALKIGTKSVMNKTYSVQKGKTRILKINKKGKVSKITYKSSNKKIATVSKKGKIKAIKKGTARITVTVTFSNRKKRTAWMKIKVYNPKNSGSTSGDTNQIQITVNGKTFDGVLYNNETAKAFRNKLPMTIKMNELNGNEKYYYFSNSFPTDASRKNKINTGDLMLYGSDCLVLFYDTFNTSYSYTSVGYITNPEGLAEAVGSGSVSITYKQK